MLLLCIKITGETKWELSESDEVAENNSDNFYEGMDGISGINYNDSFNSADIEPPDSKKQTYEFSDMSGRCFCQSTINM